MVSPLSHCQAASFCINEALTKWEEKIKECEEKTTKMIEHYYASEMATERWRMLNHNRKIILRERGINYKDAGIFQNAHRISKKQCRKRSQKRKSALEETLGRTIAGAKLANRTTEARKERQRCARFACF